MLCQILYSYRTNIIVSFLYLQILGDFGVGYRGGRQDRWVTGQVQDPQVNKVLLVELGEDLVVPVQQVHVLLVVVVGFIPANHRTTLFLVNFKLELNLRFY